MNKEEKKVINILKRTIKNSNFCDNIGTGQIKIVLNYIDKLQKENEEHIVLYDKLFKAYNERVEEILKLEEENEELDKKFRYAVPDEMIDELYVSKDKIKVKIEEVEKEYNNCKRGDTFKKAKLLYQIKILKELLGE